MSRGSTVFALACLCAAAGFAGWAGWRALQPAVRAGIVDAAVGGVRLRLDQAYLRAPDDAGRRDQIDLVARFPDFRPAGAASMRGDASATVAVRLQPQDGAVAPDERPVKLYVRFLERDQWTHPGGLIMRRFEPGSPYEREELYFAPPEGRLFAARCMRPAQPPDSLPNTCISELRMRGLDVQLRFSPELLPEWEQLTAGARGLVESMAR